MKITIECTCGNKETVKVKSGFMNELKKFICWAGDGLLECKDCGEEIETGL